METDRLEREIHAAVNDVRTDRDRGTVAYDPDLRPVARYHSSRMGNGGELFHEAPDGEQLRDRLAKFGYDLRAKTAGQRFCHECGADVRILSIPKFCPGCGAILDDAESGSAKAGENLARQVSALPPGGTGDEQLTAIDIVEGWLDSPEHRENLLNPAFDREAIGVVLDRDASLSFYVTQVLS